MELRFDPGQEHQLQAISAVVELFAGQPAAPARLGLSLGTGLAAVANRLDLSGEELLANLRAVQERAGIAPDGALRTIEGEADAPGGRRRVRFPNFSVEMETGTGKTYVYLRTLLELHRRYGWRKFIVVVPSVAVREGVLKALQVTRRHLRALYHNLPYRFYAYDSSTLSQVRQFALSDSVEIMVMTIDAFTRASNVIRQDAEALQGETPIHLVQATRPVLVLDEPQNLETPLRIEALSSLDPLVALRYSATHRNPYNLVHRLTPVEAYRRGLVKQVEVLGVVEEDASRAFLRLVEVRRSRNAFSARVAVHGLTPAGAVRERTITVKPGDSLEARTGRAEYAGLRVEEIDHAARRVRFADGLVLSEGEEHGTDRERIFGAQIRATLEKHFRKQRELRPRGVKVLSLFFLDAVESYVGEDALVRRLFRRAFEELKEEYPEWAGHDPEALQGAYFAARRTRSGEVVYEDSVSGEAQKDREAYDLIMRDKERLLSFAEPVCFLFSHSALREGWDNPNVFQICTLNRSVSPLRKRQEIGRGVRLAVDQEGERVHDPAVNVLSVVANESYRSFVERYQRELEEDFGPGTEAPPVRDGRRERRVRLRAEALERPELRALWERIGRRTRYSVRVDSAALVEEVAAEIERTPIRARRLVFESARVEADAERDALVPLLSGLHTHAHEGGGARPNLVAMLEDLLQRTRRPVALTRRRLLQVVRSLSERKLREALGNPQEFAGEAARILKRHLERQMAHGISYHPTGERYPLELARELRSWEDATVPSPRGLYDHAVVDSPAEERFVRELEAWERVRLYLKLPSWFVVDTPVGAYTPGWALVVESPGGEPRYLVREVRGGGGGLREEEALKAACARRHFSAALGVDYDVVTGVEELRAGL